MILPSRLHRAILLTLCTAAACLGLAACGQQPAAATPESAAAETVATSTPKKQAVKAEPVSTATVLEETADAGRSYVDNTLFIGDSNTARYMMYADDTGAAFTTVANNIGVVSMGADSITTLKCEEFKNDSQMYTIPDAVAKLKPQRIIIGFGTNNLSGSSTDASSFISKYRAGLQAIEEAWPYCDIIVNAIPPLDKQRENTNLTMVQVDAYNAALIEMCEEEGYKFLNTAEVLRDDDTGWAKKDYTLADGVHLSKTAVTALFEYVRTHSYITPDRRPQPLGDIPTPAGSPVGLISSDPIAVRGAKVPVEFVSAGGGYVSGSTSQRVAKGGTCAAVTAVANAGWSFSHWTASYGSVGGGATIYFTVPSSANANGVVVTAHFVAEQHEHDYVEISGSRVDPTYDYAGSVQYECTICGDVIEESIPQLVATPAPTAEPTPTPSPTAVPTAIPTAVPTAVPTEVPTAAPTAIPTAAPTEAPTAAPTAPPTQEPTAAPTAEPAPVATEVPTPVPTEAPTPVPATPEPISYTYTDEVVPPSCTTEGYTIHHCNEDSSKTYSDSTVPALGHDYQGGAACVRCGAANPDYAAPTEPPAAPAPEAPAESIAQEVPAAESAVQEPPAVEAPAEGGA